MENRKSDIIKTDDASHAYRGYRKQILFIIHEILTSSNDDLIFCPEGIEDCSVEDSVSVHSIFQVKDLSEPLRFSDLTSGTKTSFLIRAYSYYKDHPNSDIVFAHYNPLGPELQNMKQNDKGAIETVVKKLNKLEICPENDSEAFIQKISFRQLSEQDIVKTIKETIKSSILGIDIENALDNLCWWIFKSSEKQEKITKKELLKKVQDIGKFIRDRSLHFKWLGSVIPFTDLVNYNSDRNSLKTTFKEGISTSMPHICEGLDIKRENKLIEIEKSFQESNIIIIHGASGQGKTALALRYFYENLPLNLSYQIKEASDREQAYVIGESIIKHHKAFNMPMYLYYDISPNDDSWIQVLERLSNEEGIYILATIREEDLRKSSSPREQFNFKEIELSLEKKEAELIFNKFQQRRFTNFEESWLNFAEKGALLEYIYLLNYGERLEDKLKNQIDKILDQVNQRQLEKEFLDVLRIIALVTGYEARVVVNKIESLLMVPAPNQILDKLNKEYLIRVSEDGRIVEGFHPIRSRIISNYLFDEVFTPWKDILPKAFPAIYEKDLEIFLLHCFSRKNRNEHDAIINLLNNYSPLEWNTFSGIISSLLWFGIDKYVGKNKFLVDELKEEVPDLDFMIALDTDIAGSSPNLSKNLIESFQKQAPERAKIIESIQKRQSDKKEVFQYLKNWLSSKRKNPNYPEKEQDYLGLSEFIFWLGFCNVEYSIDTELLSHIDKNIESLDIQIIAEIIYSINQNNISDIRDILHHHNPCIQDKLVKSLGILYLEQDEEIVKANYIIPIIDDSHKFTTAKKENNNAKSMHIIELLHKLYPNQKFYSTQGFGHRNMIPEIGLIPEQLPDDTYKKIPKENLLPHKLVKINGIFIGRMRYLYRLFSWEDYINQIIKLRANQLEIFDLITKGLNKYYKTKSYTTIVNTHLYQLLVSHVEELKKVPKLPKAAVDEWGLVREDMSNDWIESTADSNNKSTKTLSLSIIKFKEYTNICRDFFSYSSIFINHFSIVVSNRIKQEEVQTISGNNLTDIMKFLTVFQKEFREHFLKLTNKHSLTKIEEQENKIYTKLFGIWTAFLLFPEKKIKNSVKTRDLFVRKLFKNKIIYGFKNNLNSIPFVRFQLKEANWNNKKSLWVIAEIKNPVDFVTNEPDLYESLLTGIYITKSFKSAISNFNHDELIYFLQIYWNDICVVFTCNGKIIFRTVYQKYILSVISEEITPYFNHPVDDNFFQNELNLNVLHSKQIDLAYDLLGNFMQMKVLLGHMLEIICPIENDNIDVDETMSTVV